MMPSDPRDDDISCVRVLTAREVSERLVNRSTSVLDRLVGDGAALGWVEPPTVDDVGRLLTEVVGQGPDNACLVVARAGEEVVGLGYWLRYARPTHRPHADLEKLAVSPDYQRHGVGRALLGELIRHARAAHVEKLTLDFRGDNIAGESLYRSMGFREYGRLPGFVAPDEGHRYDMVMHVLDLQVGG